MAQGGSLASHHSTPGRSVCHEACAVENLDSDYRNRNIYILSVKIQLKQLTITTATKVGLELPSIPRTTGLNKTVQLIRVPGHEGSVGNETAYQLAKLGTEYPFIGPKPVAASQEELPRKLSGTGQTEIIQSPGNP
jgi:hypothetical protein